MRVHAHGFHKRFGLRYLWGWHVRGQLELGPALLRILGGRPLCLNLQHMRYGAWYAYPRAGQPGEHYLGTSLIAQSAPRTLAVEAKLRRMLEHLGDVARDQVRLVRLVQGSERQGWRPQPSEQVGPAAVYDNGEVWLRPQYASGWRHHLTVWDQFWRLIRRYLRPSHPL